ncbi:uncharacterized protein FIESC28_07265 [Fusarium coffeatum]|uniref:Uncharacterized protein n=1 Tax=Fusarium coffeatum TaxID=231269 RepID=A0A366RES9_9HYPO|nr:uncharacterized protein FIESC28_07265 [Fusarium coffeatum]RBR15624.1 hypothetical protein FIESC28_07265 [Fusarium coffeatum]
MLRSILMNNNYEMESGVNDPGPPKIEVCSEDVNNIPAHNNVIEPVRSRKRLYDSSLTIPPAIILLSAIVLKFELKMSDDVSLLDSDLRQAPRGPVQRNTVAGVPARLKPWRIIFQMVIFNLVSLFVMVLHWVFFDQLNNRPVDETIPQNLSSALANFLAILAEIALLGGLGIAYEQILRNVWKKRPVFGLEEVLGTLNSSPWNLFRRKVFRWISKVRELWIVSLLCAGIPFAIVFPPGALTVEFENSVITTLRNVPTMNISDYGNGTYGSFVEKSLFEMNGDFSYMNEVRPSLRALASQVLSSDGPRFNCRHIGPEEALISNCPTIYAAKDHINRSSDALYSRASNSFKISWFAELCNNQTLKTLDCHTTLATYNLQINNSRDASQSITVKVENEREFWNDTAWIQTQFFYYFFYGDDPFEVLKANDTLRANFTNAQAFAISRGAVDALQGAATRNLDGFSRFFQGNATEVLGSPYVGMKDRFSTELDITPEKIERYLQDVVVSTISLGVSTHDGDVQAKTGAEIYKFSDKVQFFAGYGSSVAVAVCICVFSCISIIRNRGASGPTLVRAIPLQRFEALG